MSDALTSEVTVTNVEFLQFEDQTIAAAPTGGLLVGGDITNETITGTAFVGTEMVVFAGGLEAVISAVGREDGIALALEAVGEREEERFFVFDDEDLRFRRCYCNH